MRDFILASKLAPPEAVPEAGKRASKKVADKGDLMKIKTFLKNACGELAEPSARLSAETERRRRKLYFERQKAEI